MDLLLFGQGGAINPLRVVAVASARSTPIKRLLKITSPDHILDLTYGYPRAAVILFDNGYLALVNRTPGEIVRALHAYNTSTALERLTDSTGSTVGTSSETNRDIPPWW